MPMEWETTRGDEWWFSNFIFEAEGWVNKTDFLPTFEISISQIKNQKSYTVTALHQFLYETHTRFPDLAVKLVLTDSVTPLLEELEAKAVLHLRKISTTHEAHALISDISEP